MNSPAVVFLHEYCKCGSRIYRHWTERRVLGDGCEGDLICAEVEDRCESCGHIYAKSKNTTSPGREIGKLFSQWDDDRLSRDDFDRGVARVLRQAGGSWEIREAS